MNLDRRMAVKSLVGTAATLALPLSSARAADPPRRPRRFVFFLQNHGFMPAHALPDGVPARVRLDKPEQISLRDHKLPQWIGPLEPIKDRVTILQNLNGRHVRPIHGSPYGALGGYAKSETVALGETIDCALGKAFPGVLPAIIFGWDTLTTMRSRPIHYASSAWEAGRPAPMFCDPLLAFNNLFGIAQPGAARDAYEADSELFDVVRKDVENFEARLPQSERAKFGAYSDGIDLIHKRRQTLLSMVDKLRAHAPKMSDKYTKPRFESDWWDAMTDIGIAALVTGVTNVVTIASGRCESYGSWDGIGLKSRGHGFGHVNPPDDWLLLRRHNMEVLLRFVRALEAIPEGDGTMMDNTVIVYTSDAAEAQHSTGHLWPFLLVGNLGGRIASGQYIRYPVSPKQGSRTINALYCSLLHAAGVPRDHFNLFGSLEKLDQLGPLPELMA
jgi:hypothetical protein